MLAALTNNPDVACALGVVTFVLGIIVVVVSRWAVPLVLAGVGLITIGLAATLAWWPA